jgi:hypothetical protein
MRIGFFLPFFFSLDDTSDVIEKAWAQKKEAQTKVKTEG